MALIRGRQARQQRGEGAVGRRPGGVQLALDATPEHGAGKLEGEAFEDALGGRQRVAVLGRYLLEGVDDED
jgi:hypothetical protein